MNCILDTTAYTQLNRGDKTIAQIVREAEHVFLPQFTIAELRFGFALGSRLEENEALLRKFLSAVHIDVIFADDATTAFYVSVAVYARKHGKQLSHNDIWIAALAQQHGAELLTFDKDFKGISDIEGLRLQVLAMR